jgi:hypothetical protein
MDFLRHMVGASRLGMVVAHRLGVFVAHRVGAVIVPECGEPIACLAPVVVMEHVGVVRPDLDLHVGPSRRVSDERALDFLLAGRG